MAIIGTRSFGVAAVAFGGAGAVEAVRGIGGAGQLVSAGLVSALALAAFVPLLWRTLRAAPS